MHPYLMMLRYSACGDIIECRLCLFWEGWSLLLQERQSEKQENADSSGAEDLLCGLRKERDDGYERPRRAVVEGK